MYLCWGGVVVKEIEHWYQPILTYAPSVYLCWGGGDGEDGTLSLVDSTLSLEVSTLGLGSKVPGSTPSEASSRHLSTSLESLPLPEHVAPRPGQYHRSRLGVSQPSVNTTPPETR